MVSCVRGLLKVRMSSLEMRGSCGVHRVKEERMEFMVDEGRKMKPRSTWRRVSTTQMMERMFGARDVLWLVKFHLIMYVS